MKMTKRSTVIGVWAKKEPYEYEGKQYDADLMSGDRVRILNAGEIENGEFGERTVFSIMTRNGERNLALNQSSINVLVDEFGEESAEWVGRDVRVLLKKDVVAGKRVIIAYLVTDGWYLDDFGDLTKQEAGDSTLAGPAPTAGPAAMPDSYNQARNLNPEDIPFNGDRSRQ
tara:strand:- start:225 stop:737 length:513 start_codon:yes stop_codon:yes gene_type:complete